jgi:hypothetical protein
MLLVTSDVPGRRDEAHVPVGPVAATALAHGKEGSRATGEAAHPAGWWWLSQLHKGDFLNFLGIAFLAGVTIVCYIRILPILFAKKDRIYGVIALAEVLVLSLAASGLLRGGGH